MLLHVRFGLPSVQVRLRFESREYIASWFPDHHELFSSISPPTPLHSFTCFCVGFCLLAHTRYHEGLTVDIRYCFHVLSCKCCGLFPGPAQASPPSSPNHIKWIPTSGLLCVRDLSVESERLTDWVLAMLAELSAMPLPTATR